MTEEQRRNLEIAKKNEEYEREIREKGAELLEMKKRLVGEDLE